MLARLHAKFPDWCLEMPWVQSWKCCSSCSYEELLGKSSPGHTVEHHHLEAIVIPTGPVKKWAVNTRVQL